MVLLLSLFSSAVTSCCCYIATCCVCFKSECEFSSFWVNLVWLKKKSQFRQTLKFEFFVLFFIEINLTRWRLRTIVRRQFSSEWQPQFAFITALKKIEQTSTNNNINTFLMCITILFVFFPSFFFNSSSWKEKCLFSCKRFIFLLWVNVGCC